MSAGAARARAVRMPACHLDRTTLADALEQFMDRPLGELAGSDPAGIEVLAARAFAEGAFWAAARLFSSVPPYRVPDELLGVILQTMDQHAAFAAMCERRSSAATEH